MGWVLDKLYTFTKMPLQKMEALFTWVVASNERKIIDEFLVNCLRSLHEDKLEANAKAGGIEISASIDERGELAIGRFFIMLWVYQHKSMAVTNQLMKVAPVVLEGNEAVNGAI